MIPAAFCGTTFSIMTTITALTGIGFGPDVLGLSMEPLFIGLVGILSFVYIRIFYHEQLNCKCHNGWLKKGHKGFTYFVGLAAAFSAYYFPQLSYLFTNVAAISDFDLLSVTASIGTFEFPAILALPIITITNVGIMKGIFLSMDNKPHFFFTTKESPIDKHLLRLWNYLKGFF